MGGHREAKVHSQSYTTQPAWWAIAAAPAEHDMVACMATAGVGNGCRCLELPMPLAWQLTAAPSVTRMKAPCSLSRWAHDLMPRVSRCSWLAHDLCHSYPRGWKSKNLATLTAIMEVALFPTKTYVVGDSSNTGKSSDAGRLQFGYTSSSHFIKGIPLSLSFSFLLTSFFFSFKAFTTILYFK